MDRKERGESDLLFTIYTKDFGRIEILGKAIRKIDSKLRPAADIFYFSEIEFIQGKTQKTLTDAILLEKFSEIQKDFKKRTLAYKISETLDNFIKGQEPDEKIWQLLIEALQKLNSSEKLEIIYYYFFWNFISLLGYAPELYLCAICRKKLTPAKLCFSVKEGSLICQSCSKEAQLNQDIGQDTVKILRMILKKDWKTFSKLKIEEKRLEELESISREYCKYLCENSSSF